jgi:hypothetical protein
LLAAGGIADLISLPSGVFERLLVQGFAFIQSRQWLLMHPIPLFS